MATRSERWIARQVASSGGIKGDAAQASLSSVTSAFATLVVRTPLHLACLLFAFYRIDAFSAGSTAIALPVSLVRCRARAALCAHHARLRTRFAPLHGIGGCLALPFAAARAASAHDRFYGRAACSCAAIYS